MHRVKGRFFYGMPYNGSSQWIYTHPEEGAPRTGEGVFRMEVIEVVQVSTGGSNVCRVPPPISIHDVFNSRRRGEDAPRFARMVSPLGRAQVHRVPKT